MAKNKAARRSGEAVAAMHRNAGPMRHRLALRGNARSRANAEALDEGHEELIEAEYDAYTSEY